MSALVAGVAGFAWIAIGLWGAAWLARGNQRRAERRVPAIERRIGWVYLAGALAGPAAPVIAAVALTWFRGVDAADERSAGRAKARRLAARRAEREAERDTGSGSDA